MKWLFLLSSLIFPLIVHAAPGSYSGNFEEGDSGVGHISWAVILIAVLFLIAMNLMPYLLKSLPLKFFRQMDEAGAGIFWMVFVFLAIVILGWLKF
ncbi:hypothetical protein [Geobacter benzoatilyticus]|uniref:Uncharacterized protein n=1 Tax=Geobacter benzoatilyticus TaxID=2815309 RepID=A0ABX7Q4Y9_9BACT|nr:hypothetical protein [Geobacter benzoatilyticus]QSV46161.1 hypothetical protein JZM60_02435 [Geobacter benzoatilyticus]